MSLAPHHHAARRAALLERVEGPVLLVGHGVRDRNLPGYGLPFRQDSTFLYFTGVDLPDAAALLRDGRFELFLPPPADDDALWHGHTASLDALGERFGADVVHPAERLADEVAGLRARTVAVADAERTRLAARLTGAELAFGRQFGDPELVRAVIALRRRKGPEELEEMRAAAEATRQAFDAVMRATRPGGHEHGLAVLFEAVLAMHHCTPGYDTILSQSGEILHNHAHGDPLEAGRLLLLDGGGEVPSGYGVDITRTWPVSGRFEGRQRAAYEAVLEAQLAAIDRCREGVPYREVHDTACRVLARYLVDEGLLRGDPDGLVESGAHAVFFPHGVGHHLGLDVHDLDAFADLPSYPEGVDRSEAFGTRYLRLVLPLEPGWVVTVEPGLYFVPAILADPVLRERFRDQVDFARAESWLGFGGIRIEDDVHVTASDPEVLTSVPKEVAEVEALVGAGPTAEVRLCGS